MILEEHELLRRKTAMVLFSLEQSLGQYILSFCNSVADLDAAIVQSIKQREAARGRQVNPASAKDLLSICYLEDLLQLAEKIVSGTSDAPLFSRLRELIRVLGISEVRNACAHPMRPFLKMYWYRVCAIGADQALAQLGLDSVYEALASAESGLITDPPAEWLADLRWSLPNNLPDRFEHAGTGFVGRKGLREKLLAALANPRNPTISLVARGGVGKTALILDVLRHISESPKDNEWCDRIIYASLKTDFLTATKILKVEAAQTISELREQIAQALADQAGMDISLSTEEIFSAFSADRVLLCVDNLETLLRDNPEVFAELNSSLPSAWRIVVTSRVRVDGALTIPVDDLKNDEAVVLAHKYGRSTGFTLPDGVARQVADLSRNNALAVKLTIDLLAAGHELGESVAHVANEISQFSYDRLIDALTDESVKALEVMFVFDGCARADILAILGGDADSVSEALGELSNTSLITREIGESTEHFHLNDSVREFLRVNPRNLKFRNEVAQVLRKRRESHAQAKAMQEAKGAHDCSLDYIPSDIPDQLVELVVAAIKVSKDKRRKLELAPVIAKFRAFEPDFSGYEIFWRSYGRVLQSLDPPSAEAMYVRAREVDPTKPQAAVLLAWLFSQQGKHLEAVAIYEELVKEGWLDESSAGEQISSYIREGYVKSLLYGARFGEVLSRTADWKASPELTAEQAPYRIAAYRQIEQPLGDKSDNLTRAFDALDYAISKTGVSKPLAYQGMKLYKDFVHLHRRGMADELTARGIRSLVANLKQMLRFASKEDMDFLGLEQLSADCTTREVDGHHQLATLVSDVLGMPKGREKMLREAGYVVARVSNIPKTADGLFPRYLFAKDSDGSDYFIPVDSLRSGDWVEWSRIDVGTQVIVRPESSTQSMGKATRSLETIVA